MSVADRFPFSYASVRKVKGIQFSVWNPEELVSGLVEVGLAKFAARLVPEPIHPTHYNRVECISLSGN